MFAWYYSRVLTTLFGFFLYIFFIDFFPDFIILQVNSRGLTIFNFFNYYVESLTFFCFLKHNDNVLASFFYTTKKLIWLTAKCGHQFSANYLSSYTQLFFFFGPSSVQTIFHPIPNSFFFFLAFISMPPISPRKCCLSTTNNFFDYILELKEISLIDKTKSIITIQHNLIPIAW
jgi:hypothetical protein